MPFSAHVEDQHPLKQGLKQSAPQSRVVDLSQVEDQHPLKQGLKLGCWAHLQAAFKVEDQHPLKQGLKQL